jgi:hypothetical protein
MNVRLRTLSISALAGATLLAAAPAWADRYGHDPYGRGRIEHPRAWHGHGHRPVVLHPVPVTYYPAPAAHYYYGPPRQVIVERPVYVERVVERPVYVPAPAPGAYGPSPPTAHPGAGTGWGTAGGAVAGALLGSRVGKGSGQVAGIALGSVLGAYVGHQLSR